LVYLGLTCSCFAYNIEPYPEKAVSAPQAPAILNLVFCPLGYQENTAFFEDIATIIDRLGKTKPFNEFTGSIRFYDVNLSREEEKMIFQERPDFPPLRVRKDFLDSILSQLKSNYKLIIIDASGSVSCAELSSIDKLSLVILGRVRYVDKGSLARGFLHELGHSLGLRDECLDCQQLSLPGPPNCAANKKKAERLWGDLVGKDPRVNYISGCCGNKAYIRPVIASFMNDPDKAEDFGPVNESYLRREFQSCHAARANRDSVS